MRGIFLFLIGMVVCTVKAQNTNAVRGALAATLWKADTAVAWNHAAIRATRADLEADRAWRDCTTPESIHQRQMVLRKKMISAIGGFPERCPLNAKVTGVVQRNGYRIEKVIFESLPNFHLTGLFFRPDGPGPFPAFAITCGHSGNGKGAAGYQRAAVLGAKAGIAALIYDPIAQGERFQGKNTPNNVYGHNHIGIRASLLGWSMARFRIWDAMRVFDYLASRPDVDASRMGLMGNSGGGTLTSLTMALEPRVKAAAPSCYLSTLRDVIADCGPQDAEQNIFGQLSFGLNHAGYVLLRAPSPVCMMCKQSDFFPFRGALSTADLAREVFARLGVPHAYDLVDVPGPHGWVESTRMASVDWMRLWLKAEKNVFRERAENTYAWLDPSFSGKKNTECGLPNPEYNVTAEGRVDRLPGEKSVYDVMCAELARLEKGRTLPDAPAERAALVRRLAGIGDAGRTEVIRFECVESKEFRSRGFLLAAPGEPPVPAVLLTPNKPDPARAPLLILPVSGRVSALAQAASALAENRVVLVADLRGFGETGSTKRSFYGHKFPEEGTAVLHYLLGESLVGKRAEDIARCVRLLAEETKNGKPVELMAFGRAAIPAAHARAAFPDRIGHVTLVTPPPAWTTLFTDLAYAGAFTDCVNGALRSYDWVQLLK